MTSPGVTPEAKTAPKMTTLYGVELPLFEFCYCEKHGPGRHSHGDAFGVYWDALTDEQQQAVRDKARWEHVTLMAVAGASY